MTARDVVFSVIEFRPDPTDPLRGRIPLGVAVEGMIDDAWVTGLMARTVLTAAETESLDETGKALLSENPSALINQQVSAAFSEVSEKGEPGDTLRTLAEGSPWSIHYGPPQLLTTQEASLPALRQRLMKLYAFNVSPSAKEEANREPRTSRPFPGWMPEFMCIPLLTGESGTLFED